ncbi:Protein of unknown function DUF1376 [uncultured Caudovirales phage]|uniref:DUF1376 domain-containing protein n=1 Tax=uncultured Caudovirales phage TaxID=2100421 RepID=A0A6J5LGL9_9CAUD|nr:Protein of unknown function DUF1376 [uncultured Caudovirales phage]
MHYYQFNIGDYKSHTEHLSEMEDLAYRRLLDWYYLHEIPIPIDINETARQIRMRSHIDCIAIVLQEYFVETENGWINHRANLEIAKAGDKSQKASESAKARWKKDNKLQADAMRTHSESNATHNTQHITQDTIKRKATVVATPDGVSSDVWDSFVAQRKASRAVITETVIKSIQREANKAGWSLEQALAECAARGWRGFKADWVTEKQNLTKTGQMNQTVMSGLTRGLIGGGNNVKLLKG